MFHSIPEAEVGNSGLKLSPCLIAKIYMGNISTWDHADIRAENPSLKVPAGTAIKVAYRKGSSSSSAGLAGYLSQQCPGVWTLGSSAAPAWPVGSMVDGSPGMQSYVVGNSYAIGYLDAGHGHVRNLQEVSLQNAAGSWLSSKQSLAASDSSGNNGVAAAAASALAAGMIPSATDVDFSSVNLFMQAGTNTWPIVLISYLYINKDMSFMSPDTVGLLKAFVDFILSSEGQNMLPSFSFNAIPASMSRWAQSWSIISKPANLTVYSSESSFQAIIGQNVNVVSSLRNAFPLYKLDELELSVSKLATQVSSIQSGLSDDGLVPLHGSGTTNPKNWIGKAMKLMEHRARAPLILSYRAIGSGAGQREFVGQSSNGNKSYSHFGCADIPMTSALFKALPPGQEMLHIPFGLNAVGIFHTVPGNVVKADACLLAEIFTGNVMTWDDPKVLVQNPKLNVPKGSKIIVGHRSDGSSSTAGLSGYLNKTCPDVWTRGSGATIQWPSDERFIPLEGSGNIQNLLKTRNYAITYIEASHGHDVSASEVELRNQAGTIQTAKISMLRDGVRSAAEAALQAGRMPSDAAADWSSVDLFNMPGTYTWPISLLSYFYVKIDQTQTSSKTAAALKAFLTMMLDDEDNLCQEFGFTKLPDAVKATSKTALTKIVFPANMVDFSFESEKTTQLYTGMMKNVISSKRYEYNEYYQTILLGKVKSLEERLSALKSSFSKPFGQVKGSVQVKVGDVNSFSSNLAARDSIASGLAKTAGVPAAWVSVSFVQSASSRRLTETVSSRKLQMGSLNVAYTITPTDSSIPVGTVAAAIGSSPASVTLANIANEVLNAGFSGSAYSVSDVSTLQPADSSDDSDQKMESKEKSTDDINKISIAAIVISIISMLFSSASLVFAFRKKSVNGSKNVPLKNNVIGALTTAVDVPSRETSDMQM